MTERILRQSGRWQLIEAILLGGLGQVADRAYTVQQPGYEHLYQGPNLREARLAILSSTVFLSDGYVPVERTDYDRFILQMSQRREKMRTRRPEVIEATKGAMLNESRKIDVEHRSTSGKS